MKASVLDQYTVRDILVDRKSASLRYSTNDVATIEEALELMLTHDILSLPVFAHAAKNAQKQLVDVVSLYDICHYIVSSKGIDDEVQFQMVSGRPSGTPSAFQDTICKVIESRDHTTSTIDINASLEDLVLQFTTQKHHRVLIDMVDEYDFAEFTSNTEEGNGEGVCGLTQSDVVRFIQKHNHRIEGKLLDTPVLEISHEKKESFTKLPTVRVHETALSALRRLCDLNISAIPVVDGDGRLVSEVARTSVRLLTEKNIGLLGKPVLAYMFGLSLPVTAPYVVYPKFTISQVMAGLLRTGARRAWIVDENESPVSVITFTDILYHFL